MVYVAESNVFCYGNVLSEDEDFVTIKLSSGGEKMYPHNCVFDNQDYAIAKFKKDNHLK